MWRRRRRQRRKFENAHRLFSWSKTSQPTSKWLQAYKSRQRQTVSEIVFESNVCFIFGYFLLSQLTCGLDCCRIRTKATRTNGMKRMQKAENRRKKVHATEFSLFSPFLPVCCSVAKAMWHLEHLIGPQRHTRPHTHSINLLVLFDVWSNYVYKLCQAMHVLTRMWPFHSSFTILIHVFFVHLVSCSLAPLFAFVRFFDYFFFSLWRKDAWNELEWNPLD